ncbi:MAG TPA: tyrosine-type recombinase/integrase, partial [Microthrixaceae bacterium]|nr:tyrosine-type recombinase/integrase [Microthrixaceae bacterium]
MTPDIGGTDMVIQAHRAHLHYRGLRDSTIYQRGRVLVRLKAHTRTELLDTTAHQIEDRLATVPAAESRACELSHLRGFYGWAVEVGHLEVDPTARLRRPRTYRRLPRPIAEDDLATALAEAPDRVRPWLLLAGWAGLRASEIAQLRAEDLDETYLVVRESKNHRDGIVPLSPWLVDQLRRCDLARHGWLFPRHDGRPGPNRAWTVSQLANRHLHSLGLADTLHTLRHRFGTQVQRAGRDFRVTQELMRHESPVSTAIYTLVDRADLAAAVRDLPV